MLIFDLNKQISNAESLADKLSTTCDLLNDLASAIIADGNNGDAYDKVVSEVIANSITSATMAAVQEVRKIHSKKRKKNEEKKNEC